MYFFKSCCSPQAIENPPELKWYHTNFQTPARRLPDRNFSREGARHPSPYQLMVPKPLAPSPHADSFSTALNRSNNNNNNSSLMSGEKKVAVFYNQKNLREGDKPGAIVGPSSPPVLQQLKLEQQLIKLRSENANLVKFIKQEHMPLKGEVQRLQAEARQKQVFINQLKKTVTLLSANSSRNKSKIQDSFSLSKY